MPKRITTLKLKRSPIYISIFLEAVQIPSSSSTFYSDFLIYINARRELHRSKENILGPEFILSRSANPKLRQFYIDFLIHINAKWELHCSNENNFRPECILSCSPNRKLRQFTSDFLNSFNAQMNMKWNLCSELPTSSRSQQAIQQTFHQLKRQSDTL